MWLRGMGHDATILDEDVSQVPASKINYSVANMVVDAPLVLPEDALKKIANGALLVDASEAKIIATATRADRSG